MAFYGLFYALTNPVLKALVVESVASDVRGRALGIYSFLTSVTTLLFERDYRSVVEDLWPGGSVLFFGGDCGGLGGGAAGAPIDLQILVR